MEAEVYLRNLYSVRSQPGLTDFWLELTRVEGILISNRIIKCFQLYQKKLT